MTIGSALLIIFIFLFIAFNFWLWNDPLRLALVIMTQVVGYVVVAGSISLSAEFIPPGSIPIVGYVDLKVGTSDSMRSRMAIVALLGFCVAITAYTLRDIIHRKHSYKKESLNNSSESLERYRRDSKEEMQRAYTVYQNEAAALERAAKRERGEPSEPPNVSA